MKKRNKILIVSFVVIVCVIGGVFLADHFFGQSKNNKTVDNLVIKSDETSFDEENFIPFNEEDEDTNDNSSNNISSWFNNIVEKVKDVFTPSNNNQNDNTQTQNDNTQAESPNDDVDKDDEKNTENEGDDDQTDLPGEDENSQQGNEETEPIPGITKNADNSYDLPEITIE